MTNSTEIQAVKNRFGIIGNAAPLNYALNIAIQVAPTDLTVLISGESGSGKESFSKIIHGLSPRKHGPFIAINCGAIPEGTIDSELFGHTKGAFTGALDDRKGYFETTDSGTIFLDEIGEMPLGTQSRLLRVLENGEFIQVGSSKVKKTNVRVVAATNVNLIEAVDRGKFREDLYYRLNTVPISVPPLRDRGFDMELLFIKFTSDFAEKNRSEPVELTEAARKVLTSFRFPGNIRQLKNIAEQITLLEPSRVVNAEALEKYIPKNQSSRLPALIRQFGGQDSSDISEREILYKVLFDMRKDVTELKKLVLGMLKGGHVSDEFVHENSRLFQDLQSDGSGLSSEIDEENSYPIYTKEDDKTVVTIDNLQGKRDNVEDITHEMEEESLSLEKNENEMILKALRKNNFKRKYAAMDLGISERTLYRKIKQYDIEDEK
ncbi:sigma 54-interacting transcriptional regulator [Arcticibacterium luteifluviistationis]|uniref:Sigma-54-dependent Fis family transcriptional regulator n=1 Tax=Arcticibacterium luteifluviistationis TaxID=1784714 RepID=A0A2Z4GCR5_9BACT|nr:sigma-54 dependent transcriptional regulator [Arcticibacterium luteifluviistationis]AWV98693.1 sigma-54-dependent Fis family transcriptional regulator [Arcticibacterium luteifluviistationis]